MEAGHYASNEELSRLLNLTSHKGGIQSCVSSMSYFNGGLTVEDFPGIIKVRALD